jgi:hypothetical protein
MQPTRPTAHSLVRFTFHSHTSNYERRTGPGRKSNAEHAIAFYEYVLGEDDSGSSIIENEEEEEEEVKKPGSSKQRAEEEGDEEKTIESMDSQEFLNQHNDECDVCNLGGELLCCSTCTLVFHVDCVRPRLEELPDGDWCCAYCVLSGNEYKKHSKVWKAAAIGVRHMGRLRNSKEREMRGSTGTGEEEEEETEGDQKEESKEGENNKEESSSEPGGDVEEDAPSAAETERHVNKSSIPGDSKPRKSLALYKISDALASAVKVEEEKETTGRGRRPRRQPILYDPQICPDSRWQSDERHVKDVVTKHSDEENDSSDGEGGEQTRLSRRKRRPRDLQDEHSDADNSGTGKHVEKKTDSTSVSDKEKSPSAKTSPPEDKDKEDKKFYWCSFCRDDPNIPICVFCACRICYGKHEKEKLLLCDQCDEEYHIFCLKPPLSSVPSSKSWFCPSCKASSSASVAENKVSTRRVSSSPTKSSTGGTPTSKRSAIVKKDKSDSSTPKSTSKSGNGSDSNISPPKRPRGRPPKNKSPAQPQAPTPSPRKRGRPPKNGQPLASPPTGETPTPRKRGRPPKLSPPLVVPSVRKKPGPKLGSTNKRSLSPSIRKVDVPSSPKKARTEQPDEEDQQPKISRSGRIVKRSSFHDEMEEGEQHLRTTCAKRNESDEKSEEEGSNGDGAGDVTMVIEEDSVMVHEVDHNGHGCDDDEMSEDTGDGRPVRTKVIQPPNTTIAKPPLIVPTELDEPKATPAEPPSISISAPVPAPAPAPASIPERVPETVSEPPVVEAHETATTEPPKQEKPSEDLKTTGSGASDSKSIVPTGSNVAAPSSDPKVTEKSPTLTTTADKATAALVPTPPPATTPAPAQPAAPPKRETAKASKKAAPPPKIDVDVKALVKAAIANIPTEAEKQDKPPSSGPVKVPRRKPGARECMQISRRFGVRVIPKKYMDTLLDYCTRGKVEHLIRMRERLDEHSRFLEAQLAGLEALVREKGETDVVVPQLPERAQIDTPLNKPFQPMSVMSSDAALTSSTVTSSAKATTIRPAGVSTIMAGGWKVPVKQSVAAPAAKSATSTKISATITISPVPAAASKAAASVVVKAPLPAVPPVVKTASTPAK